MDQDDKSYTECTPEAFRQALHYLYDEAVAAGWRLPAHFIAVAAEAMSAYDVQNAPARSQCVVIPFDKPDSSEPNAQDGKNGRRRERW